MTWRSNPTADEAMAMTKLKLGALEGHRPVRLTVKLPATVHRDLIAYGRIRGRETGQTAIEPVKLVAPMLARFMATDRVFGRTRMASAE
jgi:hypothetical protein